MIFWTLLGAALHTALTFVAPAIGGGEHAPVITQSASTELLEASAFALRSGGSVYDGTGWMLPGNGYLGTLIRCDSATTVDFSILASGTSGGGAAPGMHLHVGGFKASWEVTATGTDYGEYTASWILPAGTHALRIEFVNGGDDRDLNVKSLAVAGAAFLNSATKVNCMAAANTYIENFRKGPARVTIYQGGVPIGPGTEVSIELKRHAFNFGCAVPGMALGGISPTGLDWLNGNDTDDINFRAFLSTNFNALTPENGGKWRYTEATQDVETLDFLDAMLDYGEAHNKRVRLHTLLWGSDLGTPGWVQSLEDAADPQNGGDDSTSRAILRDEISERIGYIITDRGSRYAELDGINEDYNHYVGDHTGTYGDGWRSYMSIFGIEGAAAIYDEMAAAAAMYTPPPRIFTNEYNVFQWHTADTYDNWYRRHVESLIDNGVGGIGMQYHVQTNADARQYSPHSVPRIFKDLQNLSNPELPLVLTEFSIENDNGSGGEIDPDEAANILDKTIRQVFGNDQATGFIMWGFWKPQMWMTGSALMDENWNLTPAGQTYLDLMALWDTDLTLSSDSTGSVEFTGFYGDYEVTVSGDTAAFTLEKGTTDYWVGFGTSGIGSDASGQDIHFAAIWPNPSAGDVRIRADIRGTGTHLSVAVFDITGRLVRMVADETLAPGTHDLAWDCTDTNGRHLAPGVYFCRFQSPDQTAVRKFVVVR
jgi:GH35 family endo-1,4-beta-xylanase